MHLQSRSLLSHRARLVRIGSPSKAVGNQDFVESHKGQHAAVNAADVGEMAGVNVDTKAACDHLRLQCCTTWCWTSTRFTGTLTAEWLTALMRARHPTCTVHYTDFADHSILPGNSSPQQSTRLTNHGDFSHMVSRHSAIRSFIGENF